MEAAELLRNYLDKAGERAKDTFAKNLRVSRQTVWSWSNGHSVPGEAVKGDIESETGGAVPRDAWPVVDRRKKPEGDAA